MRADPVTDDRVLRRVDTIRPVVVPSGHRRDSSNPRRFLLGNGGRANHVGIDLFRRHTATLERHRF